MGYYVGLLKAIKERFGEILKARDLVVRAEEEMGQLKIIFRASEEGWRLPTALYVNGPEYSDNKAATWEDVAVEAQVFEALRLGAEGPRGFVNLREDYFELVYVKSGQEGFLNRIAAHLESDPIVPWDAIGENVACEEVTVAYATVCRWFDTTCMPVVVENDKKKESITFPDLPGGAFRFEILKKDGIGIAYLGGEEVGRLERASLYEVERLVSSVLPDEYAARYA